RLHWPPPGVAAAQPGRLLRRPSVGPGEVWPERPVVAMRLCITACHGEETFGPVVSVYPFVEEQEAVRLANATPYGLNASVWTRDLARGRRIAARIRAGTVNVNE